MKIAIDAGCLGVQDKRLKVGVYTVVRNLLVQLGKIDKQNRYLLYSFFPIEKNLLREFGPRMENIVVYPSTGWLKFALPLRLFLDKPDIFIAASQAMPQRIPFLHFKTLGIFYDIAFEKYPQLYSYAASVTKHTNNSMYLAKHADKLVAISQSTKNDIVNYYHVPKEKILVAYPGVSRESRIKNQELRIKNRESGIDKSTPYFLFVGAFKKSKNIPILLQAFKKFSSASQKTFQLILVGGDKWMDPEIEKTLHLLPQKLRLQIVQKGFVSDKELAFSYQHAVALVSPSLYEGFGLAFLEAQSYGCPVIGSSRGSLPEVIGESGILVDPTTATDIALAMKKITENSQLRLGLVKKGYANAKKYSWKIFAKRIQSAIDLL